MKQFWAPNVPGDNITGVNNFKKGFIERYNYYNFSDRVDYYINDKWRAFGRMAGTTRTISLEIRRRSNNFVVCADRLAARCVASGRRRNLDNQLRAP